MSSFMEKHMRNMYSKYGLDYDESERGTVNTATEFYKCPRCGYAVRSSANANPKCRGCGCSVIVRNGKVKGWN